MAFVTSTVMKTLKFFIEDEFDSNHTVEGSIMRENCHASKLLKSYLGTIGLNYLESILGDHLIAIAHKGRNIAFEINPS
jgi:hypothetical protein